MSRRKAAKRVVTMMIRRVPVGECESCRPGLFLESLRQGAQGMALCDTHADRVLGGSLDARPVE